MKTINFKRFLSVLLVLAMVLAMGPTFVFAAEGTEDITVLYTNDVHTYIDGELSYADIAALKESYEDAGKPVLLVDAGDHIQGTAFGSMDNGETIVKLMNAADYDLATLGNHEFDYGMARCLNLWNESDFPYVSANFYDLENEKLVLDAYKVFELGGKKVAFVGLTTPESFTKSTPAYFQNEDGEYIYDIFGGEDGKGLYEAAQKAIDAARAEADVVIALGHLGDDPASQPWTSEELIANTTGIDAFIDGHSHSTVPMREVKNKDGETVILTQTGSYFNTIGCMTITADGTITTELVKESVGEDAEVKAIEDAWINSVNEELGQVIGAATVTFDNYENGKRLVRTVETNTGDFAADALYYLFDNMGLDVDVAVMNGGGVRNKAITGELSYLSCKSIHTFGNVACLQTITGQQLLDALEFGARFSPDAECGGFLQVSGCTYEIHTAVPNTIQTDDKNVWQGGPTGAYRVQNVQIWNKETETWEPLDLTAEYNLAGYNYTLRDLGDGFAMFDGAVNVLDYVMQDYMVLANYVQSFPVDEATGLPTITAENSPYGDVRGEGRITLVNNPAEAFQDVKSTAWYFDDVNYVVEKGLMNGISDTMFNPNGTASRAMVATVLYRLSGETVEAAEVFSDVKPTSWYGEAVTWAAANGIVNGTGNGKFNPSLNITRQDLAVMMHRYASYMGYDLSASADISGYPDADKVAPYAEKAMRWAVATGLLKGDEKGNLNPRATATRAQLAAILHRFCGLREITVLYTNDVHTYIDGTLSYANIAAMKQEIESTGKPVMLVDAGDHIQGTAFGSMDNGETIIKLMNAADYDLATLGNHEFDYGMARCLNLWNESNFPYVSANFYSLENDALVLDAYKVYRLGEKNVAFVGLTTPESFTKSTPAYFQNEDGEYIYDIFGGEDGKGLYEAAQKAIDAAREEADIVIVLGHLGDDPASQPWTSEELIANTTGIDAFIDGHSHSTVPMREVKNKDGETVVLTQTGSYFASIGKMTISEDGTITTELVKEYTGEDEAVAEIEDGWINSVNEELGQVIGAATVTFDNYENGKRLVRTYETNTGDFAADALYYLFDNMGLDVDVAVMNGGGVRNKAITGELSYLSCKSIHTFGNVACLQTITGQQLLDALEFGARFSPDAECGGFLQVSSNVSYEIHSYIPNTIVTDDKGVWQAGPTGAYRVQNVMINGEPLDLEAEYNLAGYNYTLRDLGDGFAMFDGAVNVLDYVMQDYMVLANYVQSFPVDEATGLPTITAENSPYGDVKGEGRITVVTENPVVEIEFLATSDIHGQVYPTDYTADASLSGKHYQSLANVATYFKQEREAHENVFAVDCGDLLQGTPLTYYYAFMQPETEDPCMKALRMMDYDMFVPGNHEFNYGMSILQRVLGDLTAEATETEDSVAVGCANYLAKETNSDESKDWATWNDYAPYQIYDFDGVKVAVMGIGNPNIPKWDVPANWEGIYFAGVVETYLHYEQEMLEKADLIVLASHSGIDSDPGSDFIRELVSTTNSIDLVFTGHEHRNGVTKIANADGKVINVFSLSTKAAQVGKTIVNYNKTTGEYEITAQMVPMAQSKKALYEADADMMAAFAPYETATWQDYMLQTIGTAAGNFSASNLGGAPSAFVDLVNKVQIWGAYDRTGVNTPDDPTDDTPAMLSITAPLTSGNAANLIPEGSIVLGDMFKLYRYENWFYQITMSAKEVDCWLEYSASKVVLNNGNVSISGGLTYYDVIYGEGFSYVIDPSKAAGDRVTISYNGEPVAEDFVFTVVVNNYRYNGGGNYIQWLNDHGCPFTPNDESRIVYSTQYDMIQGEDKGQARNLLADYITEQGTIYPTIDSTWSIVGAN